MKKENSHDGGIHSQYELQQLKDFYEQGPDMFVSLDMHKQTIQTCNKTTVRKLCYVSKSQLVGQHYLFLYHPKFHPSIELLIGQFCDEGKLVNEHVLLRRQDGIAIPALLSATAVRNGEGVVIGSRSVLRNVPSVKIEKEVAITDSKQMNKALLHEFVSVRELLDCLVGDERSVFEGITKGQLNKQIASSLDLSERTIERLRSRLVSKLDTKSSADLIAMASRFEVLQQLFADYKCD